MSDTETAKGTHDFTVTRIVNAQLNQVWDAWANPERVNEWWGPIGFTGKVHQADFREGGTTLVSMSSPDFGELFSTWTWTRILPSERLEFVMRFADATGQTIDPPMPGVPAEVPHVVTFKDLGNGRTELSVTESGYASEEAMQLSRGGQEQVLDKLVDSVIRSSGGATSKRPRA